MSGGACGSALPVVSDASDSLVFDLSYEPPHTHHHHLPPIFVAQHPNSLLYHPHHPCSSISEEPEDMSSAFATDLRIHQHTHEDYDILPIDPSAIQDPYRHHHSFLHTKKQHNNSNMIAAVLPPIIPRHPPSHSQIHPPAQDHSPRQHQPSHAAPPPPPQPVIPPQQRPAPVVDARERVTVNGIPSQTVADGKLVIGHNSSTSVRSYTPLKNVGDGSFGTVVLADWHSPLPPGVSISPMQLNIKYNSATGQTPMRMVAIKRMKKKWQNGWAECAQLKELESLRRIPPHPNVIPLYDAFLMAETKELYFIFECMEGNLYQLIKSRKGRPLAGGLVASIYRQVVEGLRHIHDFGYFHRDMKPENLLVTTTGLADYSPTSPLITQPPHLASPEKDVMVIVKLADFGLAREITSKPPYTEYVSTRWYRAPEVLLRSTDYSAPVDMWALGTILAELVNLKPIFPGQTEVDQVQKISEVLGNPTTRGDYGVDERGRVRGGGDWIKGIRMASSVGYMFRKMKPFNFASLFDRSVPMSLIDCIADLIRYDPEKRLTAQQCKDHSYWKETEHSQRGAIATQPTVQQSEPSPPPHASSQANGAEHQTRRRPSHIQIPRPPDTNASSTSSNKSLRAAVAGMGIHSHSQTHNHSQAGFSRSHSRTHSTQHGVTHGLVLPQMSPRTLPPSHSHPLSPGKSKPNFNGNNDIPPLPLPIPLLNQDGSSSANTTRTTHAPLSNSTSHPNLHLHAHRQGGQDSVFSPVTPSASPGALFSPSSQPGDFPSSLDHMNIGAIQYQQALSAHYSSAQPARSYTGRSYGSMPGTSGTSRSNELVEQMRDLDLPPPVPPLPWSVNGRDSGFAPSVAATVGSDDGPSYERSRDFDDDPSADMEISRGSLELPHSEQASVPSQSKSSDSPSYQSPPAPQQQANQTGGKFHLGFGFGKKNKAPKWGLFGHGQSGSDPKQNGVPNGAADASMASSNSMPSVTVAPAVQNSLKRGPSNSAGSLNELPVMSASTSSAPPPPPPVDPKEAKKLAQKARKEEQRMKYEAQQRQHKERSRAVIRKREEVLETQGSKKTEWEWERARLGLSDQQDKGKDVARGQQPSASAVGLGLESSRNLGDGRSTMEQSTSSSKPLMGPESDGRQHLYPHGSQPYPTHQYELQHHLHRHKARRRDTDDDHSMSSSDIHSVSRLSMSTVDSDPGPGRHRMGLTGGHRAATLGPYPAGPGINRATSVNNLRSTAFRGFSPSARSSTSLEQPFLSEFDELGFQPDGQGRYRGEPGSLPGASDGMGMSTMSPPMQSLTLNGRASQSPPLQDLPSHGHRSRSRGRMHPPSSFMGMPPLPSISSVHSPYSPTEELPEPGDMVQSSTGSYPVSIPTGGGDGNGHSLPPFSHIASWADHSQHQPHPSGSQYHQSPT